MIYPFQNISLSILELFIKILRHYQFVGSKFEIHLIIPVKYSLPVSQCYLKVYVIYSRSLCPKHFCPKFPEITIKESVALTSSYIVQALTLQRAFVTLRCRHGDGKQCNSRGGAHCLRTDTLRSQGRGKEKREAGGR